MKKKANKDKITWDDIGFILLVGSGIGILLLLILTIMFSGAEMDEDE